MGEIVFLWIHKKNVPKVQNNKILTFAIATEERMRLRAAREPTLSVKSTSQKLNTDSLSIQTIPRLLKSWSSWVAIGQWRLAGSWRRLREREPPSACASYSPFVNCPQSKKKTNKTNYYITSGVHHVWGVLAYLVITYCWASFIFEINSARSEFNSFWAISIC